MNIIIIIIIIIGAVEFYNKNMFKHELRLIILLSRGKGSLSTYRGNYAGNCQDVKKS